MTSNSGHPNFAYKSVISAMKQTANASHICHFIPYASKTTMSDPVKQHGFSAVPANPETVFQDADLKAKGSPVAIAVSETPTPATPLARRVDEYCRKSLPKPVYLHSLRVYHLGLAMKRYVAPDWEFSDETYFLACLLHDVGGTPENLRATFLSHEFFAGYLTLDLLQNDSAGGNAVASKPQAESVAEAIIRHQDLCQTGSLTAMGQILQLATIFGV